MNIPILSGLARMAGDYDPFIVDLWGVVHDGEAVFPGAVDCLRRLRQRGARQAGIDAVWIGGGIHADALAMGPDGRLQPDKVHAVAERAGERPKAIWPWLKR